MAISDDTIGTDYNSYAQFCLKLATQTPDRPARLILREMAARWLALADAIPAAPKRDGHDGHASHGSSPDGSA